jgi:putative SOS response-associated peptidase YedK
MCGRYTELFSWVEVYEWLGLWTSPEARPLELTPRYNIAPTQQVPVARQDANGRRTVSMLRWGFVPSWSKDGKISPINAMSETVADKPMFRSAFKKRRCLFVASGFYEWLKEGKKKLPLHFRLRSGGPLAFAGIWETWHDAEGEAVETCAILTTAANELVRPTHDRMPVILKPDYFRQWLDPAEQDKNALAHLLQPYPADEMTAVPASEYVNNARHEGDACLAAPA